MPTSTETAKSRLIEATEKIVRSGSVEELRIGDICKLAGVSRTTFYHHFESKYDALNECILSSCSALEEIGRTLTWHEGIYAHASYHLSNRDFLEKAHAIQLSGEAFNEVCANHFSEVWQRTIVEYNKMQLTEELRFQITFWAITNAYAFARLFSQVGLDAQRIADSLDHCRPKELTDAMDLPVLARRRTKDAL